MKEISRDLIIVMIMICGFLIYFVFNYSIFINLTDSLAYKIFIIEKNKLPQKRGDMVAFIPPKNPYYKDNFIKIIAAMPGDRVVRRNRDFFVKGKFIGTAKQYSLTNLPLEPMDGGLVSEDRYFVYSPHKDSYDSRYKEISLVPKDNIIGVAVFAF